MMSPLIAEVPSVSDLERRYRMACLWHSFFGSASGGSPENPVTDGIYLEREGYVYLFLVSVVLFWPFLAEREV